jgi:tetratricopeptide (TPR) repeat protein
MSRCIRFQQLIDAGKPDEAVAALLRELEQDPDYTGAYYNLGLAFAAMGQANLAAELQRFYLELAPDGYWASNARAKLLELERGNP